MEPVTIIALFIAAAAVALAAYALTRGNGPNASRMAAEEIARTTERLAVSQAELAGRLSQIAEADAASSGAAMGALGAG